MDFKYTDHPDFFPLGKHIPHQRTNAVDIDFVVSGSDLQVFNNGALDDSINLNQLGKITYTLDKLGNVITLSGSDGTTKSVLGGDPAIKYHQYLAGDNLRLSGSDGSNISTDLTYFLDDTSVLYSQTLVGDALNLSSSKGDVTSTDLSKYTANTKYSQSLVGDILSLSGNDGVVGSVNLSAYNKDDNTRYTQTFASDVLTLSGSDGVINTFNLSAYNKDDNTKYTQTLVSDMLRLSGDDGVVAVTDLTPYTKDTLYDLSLLAGDLRLSGSDASLDVVTLPPALRYVQTFIAGNFTAGVITIPQTTHQKGVNPIVQVLDALGNKVTLDSENVNTSGDVTLTVTLGSEFDGKVIIL